MVGIYFMEKKRLFAGGKWFNSVFFNVGVALILLWLSSLLLVSILEIKSKWGCSAITAITFSTPAFVVAMVFNFMAITFSYSIFLTVLGVWFSKKRKVLYFIIAGLLIARGLGGYQAYFPYAATLLMLLMIIHIVRKDNWKYIILEGVRSIILLGYSLIAYFVAWKYWLHKIGTSVSNYQGMDSIGALELSDYYSLVKQVYVNIWGMTRSDYLSLSSIELIQKSFLIIYLLVAVYVVMFTIKNVRTSLINVIELVLTVAIFPIAADAIIIMAPNAVIYSIMGFALISLFYLPVVIADNMGGRSWE